MKSRLSKPSKTRRVWPGKRARARHTGVILQALCLSYKMMEHATHGAAPSDNNSDPLLAARWRAEDALFTDAGLAVMRALTLLGVEYLSDPRCQTDPSDPLDYTSPAEAAAIAHVVTEAVQGVFPELVIGPELTARVRAALLPPGSFAADMERTFQEGTVLHA